MARNKYPEETVNKILDVSLKLFAEKGYEKTTIQDIVDELGGLTKGAIYHHFKSKEEIIDAISERIFKGNNPFQRMNERTDLTALEKLKALMIQSLNKSGEARLVDEIGMEIIREPKFMAEQVHANNEILAPMVKEIIEQGIKDGSITTKYPKAMAECFMLLVNFWYLPSVFPCTPEEFLDKLHFTKELFDGAGLYVFDEEVLKACESILDY